jgi:hypothetical protein
MVSYGHFREILWKFIPITTLEVGVFGNPGGDFCVNQGLNF